MRQSVIIGAIVMVVVVLGGAWYTLETAPVTTSTVTISGPTATSRTFQGSSTPPVGSSSQQGGSETKTVTVTTTATNYGSTATVTGCKTTITTTTVTQTK